MATFSKRSTAFTCHRSLSQSGRFINTPPEASSSFASSTSSSFCSSPSSNFLHRSSSPTRVNLHGLAPLSYSPSVRLFSIDRSVSPRRTISVSNRDQLVRKKLPNAPKKTCMCSPTTHPGSFRCSLHKRCGNSNSQSVPYSPSRLNFRRSAMTNSLVRIGTVEGDLVKRALAALIRPSSHQQRRRSAFQPRPSRLSIMSRADDGSLSLGDVRSRRDLLQ